MKVAGEAGDLARVPPDLPPCSRFPPQSSTLMRACRSLTSRSSRRYRASCMPGGTH